MTPAGPFFQGQGYIGSAWGAAVPPKVPGPPDGPAPGADLAQWARLTAERLRSLVVGGKFRFLPWFDDIAWGTDEGHKQREFRKAVRHMLRDPMVKAPTLSKVLAVAHQEVQVNPKNPDDPRERDNAAFQLDVYNGISTLDLTFGLGFPGGMDGWSIGEPVWDQVQEGRWSGKWGWKCVKFKDTHRLTPLVDDFLNVTGIRSFTGQIFDPSDFLIFRNLSLFGQPRGMSDWLASWRAFWIKRTAWELRMAGLERWAHPFLKGSLKDGFGGKLAELQAALAEIKSNTWLTVPEWAIVEAVQVASTGESDFKSAMADLNDEIVIGIAGATLTVLTSSQSDPRGDSQVQKSTTQLLQWALAAGIAGVLSRQASPLLTRVNFWGVPPPSVTLGAVDEAELASRLANDEGLQRIGLGLSRKEAYRYYSRQQPADPGDVLRPGGNVKAGPNGAAPPSPPPAQFAESVHTFAGGGAHAPTGGVTVQGTHYPGGQFIPGSVMDKATPAEKVAVAGGPGAAPAAGAGKPPHVKHAPNPGLPDAARPALTATEVAALTDYSGDGFKGINATLRAGEEPGHKDAETHDGLRRAFAQAKDFARPVTVYRGFSVPAARGEYMAGRLAAHQKSGLPLALAGYQSTTTSRDKAEEFIESQADPGNHTFEVQIAARRGLDVRPYSGVPKEDELLLNHNEQYRVKSIRSAGKTHHVIELEQL